MTAVELLQGQVTQDEAREALKGWILSADDPPEEVTLDTPGTPENAFLYALSVAEEARSDDRANIALAGYRSTAPIEWLRLHAIEFYNLPVQTAGFATTLELVTNTSGNQYGPFEPGELRFVFDDTKAVYENTAAVTILPAQLSPLVASTQTIGIRAIEAGTASNAGIGDIDRLESPLEGVTVTNTQAALTNDDESAESINRRIDALIGLAGVVGADSLSTGGPVTAVESIALNGRDKGGGCRRADGTRVTVTRTKLVRDDSTGISTLYVGDDDGPLDPADLLVVEAEVIWYAERICSTVLVENVVILSINVSGTMTFRKTSLSDSEIDDAIEAAFPAAALGVPVGGFDVSPAGVPREYIEGAVRGASAGQWQIVTIAVTTPAADVPTAVNEVVQFVFGTLVKTRIA
jgi:hypothetical protein